MGTKGHPPAFIPVTLWYPQNFHRDTRSGTTSFLTAVPAPKAEMSLPLKEISRDSLQLRMEPRWWDSATQEGAVSCQGTESSLRERALPDLWAHSGCFGREMGQCGSKRESRDSNPGMPASHSSPARHQRWLSVQLASFLIWVKLRVGCSVGSPEWWPVYTSPHPWGHKLGSPDRRGLLLAPHSCGAGTGRGNLVLGVRGAAHALDHWNSEL